ncbi:MAG: aminopeptidase [Clostridiales bacterium]|nr:aminopeptidase [Clostridiales bacterium]
MGYREIRQDTNEEVSERMQLARERLRAIAGENAKTVDERYRDCFAQMAKYLLTLHEISSLASDEKIKNMPRDEGKRLSDLLFFDVQGNYGSSYANPEFACKKLGDEYGRILSAIFYLFHENAHRAYEDDSRYICFFSELFIEIFNCFEDEDGTDAEEILGILYSFMHDYADIFEEERILRMIDPKRDYFLRIVMDSDLTDTAYLYRYGLCVGADEIGVSKFLARMSDGEVQAMADTFTEGYRIGFAVTGKDIKKKSVAEIRYPIGFERMVKFAINNFKKLGMDVVLLPNSVSLDRQYSYDHREDAALWMDRAYVNRVIEVNKCIWDLNKNIAPRYGGPAVIETFGLDPFSPEQKPERNVFTMEQRQLSVYRMSEMSRLCNEAIHGEERSFTIISYPVPSIGEDFSDIFSETVKVNTLDYALYQGMQQKIIDVLDGSDRVHVVGRNGNRTDIYVKIWELSDPERETAFENCVADVNIPVGEVFTTPVLSGTHGKLHVKQVYLEGLNYENLELDFEDGIIKKYSCTNFESEAENKKYIEDNVLFHHETLPMGEFAIGTNTAAYKMAREFDIAERMPILIAEKTGPHFAVGDTCYTYDEDNMTYNPDGKAIVARENDFSKLRKEDISQAYFNCHTDITIPYDELGKITAIKKDGNETDIIVDGRFVVPGTEILNEPLDELDRNK